MRNLLFVFIILFSINCFATQQIEDDFIVDGVTHSIDSNPLENIYKYEDIHIMLDTQGWCSANWRGYKATWELKENELWINSMVKGACKKDAPSVDPVLFFSEREFPVKAIWFNGKIELRQSKNEYQSCLDSSGRETTIGYTYKATVYEFSAGNLVYKSDQTLSHEWESAMKDCAKQ